MKTMSFIAGAAEEEGDSGEESVSISDMKLVTRIANLLEVKIMFFSKCFYSNEE